MIRSFHVFAFGAFGVNAAQKGRAAAGVIATANAHFNHSVTLWSAALEKRGAVDDFLVSDAESWASPCVA